VLSEVLLLYEDSENDSGQGAVTTEQNILS
jgi:hypothetical protein